MGVRIRGFLILLGSALGGGALTLPLIGFAIGLVECTTGMPINRADEAWQTLPGYVKYPAALIGSVLFLWAFVWLVAKALGA